MSQTVELLKLMRGKIALGWTQGCSARNRQGNPVVPSSPEASQWCLIGSVTAHAQNGVMPGMSIRSNVHNIICSLIADRNEVPFVETYNDNTSRTKEEILELLDEAISVASVGGFA